MSLRVLITNIRLDQRTGTEVYVRDLALELLRQGHVPAVFTTYKGEVAAEIERAGIPVTCHLRHLQFRPDVIHGHHLYETLAALTRFPGSPALFVCHSQILWADWPPLHPRVRRYYGVSRICVERLLAAGVPAHKASLLLNFVDTRTYVPRAPLPSRPRRALVFSNYASAATYVPIVAEACCRAGLELDVVGAGSGNATAHPQTILGGYDIVFAKGKAAMEAMAVGAAVVLCDLSGVGPMVTAAGFDDLRPLNFGYQTLRGPFQPEYILKQIECYDPADAARVRDRIRSDASLEQAARSLVDIYQQITAEQAAAAPATLRENIVLRVPYYEALSRLWNWYASLAPSRRTLLVRVPGVRVAMHAIKKRFLN